ncbi:DUF4395 domain-containing protein [Aeromicrobium camelliae]|uniref:DUF4395 domain-containing protein n=1 Tax=Aeromicrobium camelliae TaxID=1538144 RepID=A0A3N6ZRD0_9ACTN|nr:DUF4395 domain-containing protein [Aeromicrobium camelliae]RQN09627.1 DUF4395 domain-containing protein [Aeromicrobium camelliae]
MSRPSQVDPRGPRVAAALTSLVLALAIVVPPPAREFLLVLQGAVFAVGAFVSVAATPYAVFFRGVVRPRLAPPTDLEDARPPQFAQLVGLIFVVVALAGFLTGLDALGYGAAAAALVAALLNAVTGFCLGCELYLTSRRLAKSLA